MIHLDTSFLIRALARGSAEDRRLRNWLADKVQMGISTVAWAEFLCGPIDADQVRLAAHVVREQIPFLPVDATEAARLYNLSGRRRGSLADCMIAATALRCGASLATSNPADFRRLSLHGLKIA